VVDEPTNSSAEARRATLDSSTKGRSAEVDRRTVAELLDTSDGSLVDLVDSLLDKGVVLDAEIVLGLADIDLIYVRLSAVVVAADKILPPRK
jgi:hypothetical protein